MTIPEKVNLTCKNCGHTWLESIETLKAAEAIVFMGKEETVRRRVICPNCDKGVIVIVPRAWVE